MNFKDLILPMLIGFAVPILLNVAAKGNAKKLEPNNNNVYCLRVHKLYLFVGLLVVVASVSMFIKLLLNTDEVLATNKIILLLLFLVLGISALLIYFNHKVEFNSESFSVQNIFRKKKELKWSEIDELKVNTIFGFIILKAQNNKVKIYKNCVGLNTFKTEVKSKTNMHF